MQRVNFIPARRIEDKLRQRRTWRWIIAAGGCAGLLMATYLFCHRIWALPAAATAEEIDALSTQIGRKTAVIAGLRNTLTGEEQKLRACRAVSEQPDWSILLALLAGSMDEEIILRQCELKPVRSAPATLNTSAGADENSVGDAFSLRLAGYGQTQASVARYIMKLEQSELFDNVQLVKSTREPFLAGTAVAFELACGMSEGRRLE